MPPDDALPYRRPSGPSVSAFGSTPSKEEIVSTLVRTRLAGCERVHSTATAATGSHAVEAAVRSARQRPCRVVQRRIQREHGIGQHRTGCDHEMEDGPDLVPARPVSRHTVERTADIDESAERVFPLRRRREPVHDAQVLGRRIEAEDRAWIRRSPVRGGAVERAVRRADERALPHTIGEPRDLGDAAAGRHPENASGRDAVEAAVGHLHEAPVRARRRRREPVQELGRWRLRGRQRRRQAEKREAESGA